MVTETRPAAEIAVAHPLDALTPGEIERASALAIARAGGQDSIRFPLVALHEPDKAAVKAFQSGDSFERRAFAMVFDSALERPLKRSSISTPTASNRGFSATMYSRFR